MQDNKTLSHTTWDCKYHVVFTPKYRRKALYKELRQHLGDVFRSLAGQKGCRIEEGHLMLDHVHMLISIPPKYSVAQVIAADVAGDTTVGKLDVDAYPRLAAQYGIQSIPTVLVFKDGRVVDQTIGVVPKQVLLAKLHALVQPT